MGYSKGPWGTIVLIIGINALMVIIQGSTPTIFTVVAFVVLAGSLITLVTLMGANGSDPLGAVSLGFVAARLIALTVFVAAVISLSIIVNTGLPAFLTAFINLVLAINAVDGAINASTPG